MNSRQHAGSRGWLAVAALILVAFFAFLWTRVSPGAPGRDVSASQAADKVHSEGNASADIDVVNSDRSTGRTAAGLEPEAFGPESLATEIVLQPTWLVSSAKDIRVEYQSGDTTVSTRLVDGRVRVHTDLAAADIQSVEVDSTRMHFVGRSVGSRSESVLELAAAATRDVEFTVLGITSADDIDGLQFQSYDGKRIQAEPAPPLSSGERNRASFTLTLPAIDRMVNIVSNGTLIGSCWVDQFERHVQINVMRTGALTIHVYGAADLDTQRYICLARPGRDEHGLGEYVTPVQEDGIVELTAVEIGEWEVLLKELPDDDISLSLVRERVSVRESDLSIVRLLPGNIGRPPSADVSVVIPFDNASARLDSGWSLFVEKSRSGTWKQATRVFQDDGRVQRTESAVVVTLQSLTPGDYRVRLDPIGAIGFASLSAGQNAPVLLEVSDLMTMKFQLTGAAPVPETGIVEWRYAEEPEGDLNRAYLHVRDSAVSVQTLGRPFVARFFSLGARSEWIDVDAKALLRGEAELNVHEAVAPTLELHVLADGGRIPLQFWDSIQIVGATNAEQFLALTPILQRPLSEHWSSSESSGGTCLLGAEGAYTVEYRDRNGQLVEQKVEARGPLTRVDLQW